ncbi:MAG: glycogen-binding domain-containing protein, partial [Deltaproteobacteria bacterium]
APSATAVELNGDFTHWQPVRLARGTDGWWTITLQIAPGTYQVNIRVDGGPWVAPPGLLTSTDEFGGIVGILRIE